MLKKGNFRVSDELTCAHLSRHFDIWHVIQYVLAKNTDKDCTMWECTSMLRHFLSYNCTVCKKKLNQCMLQLYCSPFVDDNTYNLVVRTHIATAIWLISMNHANKSVMDRLTDWLTQVLPFSRSELEAKRADNIVPWWNRLCPSVCTEWRSGTPMKIHSQKKMLKLGGLSTYTEISVFSSWACLEYFAITAPRVSMNSHQRQWPFQLGMGLDTSTILPYYEKMGFIKRDIPDIYSPLTLTGWNLNNIFPSYDISLRRNWNFCYKVIFQRTSCQIYLYYYTLLRKGPLKWYGMLLTYQGYDKQLGQVI